MLPGRASVPGAREVDLAGHTCMPGWIDLHVHLASQSGPRSYEERFRLDDADFALRAVGYAEKTLHGRLHHRARPRRRGHARSCATPSTQGLVKGPRIYAAGKSIATTGGHADPTNGMNAELSFVLGTPGPTEGVVNGADDARQAVRQRYKDGSDLIKITATGGVLSYAKSGDAPQFTVDEVRAIVETAKDYGYKVAAHAHGKEGMKRAIEGGVTSIEHGTYMDEEIFALMKKHGTWYVPTISAGRFVAEKAKVPGYLPEIVRPKAERIGAQIQDTFGKAYKIGREDRLRHRHGRGSARRQRARVRLHGRGRHAGGRGAAVGHLPRGRGARCRATSASVEPGFRADIVAVPGDPLADIALTSRSPSS